MPPKRKSYSADYKLQVAKYAAENGNRAAERKFGVSEKLARDWRKAEGILALMQTKTTPRGRKAKWPELEERVHKWVLKERAAGRGSSTVQLRLRAMAKSDCQANCVEHLLEDTGNKSLSEDDHTEDLTGDSSATTDDLFFTSVMQNQPSQKSEVARTDSVEERRHQPRNIKTETPSYEQGEDGQLNMLCENEAKIRKREHLDISIYQYNNQQRAVEDGDLPSRTIPKQPLIENIFPPTLSPVSKPLSVLVPTHIATGTTSDMRTPPTSQMPQIVEVSSRAVSGSDKETMDLYQLKKEKIKMQLRVLKLQEEYYSLKLNELRKMTN